MTRNLRIVTSAGGGGMGRLPSAGIGWYRKALDIPVTDAGKSIFLDVDGAMAYAAVWLNGKLVGGWPFGYASWRLDLTPYVKPGGTNELAIIDLAGFKKDRYYLYQAYWRPDFPMAHILPHWTWPERVGQITPVHVFTSGDEAELFLNGQSLGRKKKGAYEYRLRWDGVVYEPGTLKVVAYKNGKPWATDEVKTAGVTAQIKLEPDRKLIRADGKDLSFGTVILTDKAGQMSPRADNRIYFAVKGPGEIVATDNGDATSFESFQSPDRKAFNGLCLVIIRGHTGQPGKIKLMAKAYGLKPATVFINTIN